MSSFSSKELQKRRKELRRRRWIESWQAIGRSLIFTGIAGSLFWTITLSNWVIRQETEIKIKGDRFLKEEAIRALIPFSSPQSLLQLPPQQLIEKIKSSAHVSQARVTRQIFPPSLTVEIQERQPVAIATSPHTATEEVGLLDEQGIWMPVSSYNTADKGLRLPTLKVTGLKEQYLPSWPELYRAIAQSKVKIFEVNCKDPSNLVLKTELGNVRFGAYTSKFPEQLTVLAQMRELPEHVAVNKIIYIDLINLKSPTIKVIEDKPLPTAERSS